MEIKQLNIKPLNKELIHRANSVSFNGTRGDSSEYEYNLYATRIIDFPVSDAKKQKLLDTLYDKWSKLLNYEAQHVSVMVAGPSKYNSKKLDKSEQVLKLSAEIANWFNEIKSQIENGKNAYTKVEWLIQQITWCVNDGFACADKWKKLAELDLAEFKALYEKLNESHPFKKNSVAYKLYHNTSEITERKKEIIFDNADFTAYTEGDRAYIKFTLRPKRQLIVALKSRGWWWNGRENAWSTYLNRLDKEWVESISSRYEKYI